MLSKEQKMEVVKEFLVWLKEQDYTICTMSEGADGWGEYDAIFDDEHLPESFVERTKG